MTNEKISKFMKEVAPAKLLVVTKTRSVREIREVIDSGVKYIGENTLQEVQKKYDNNLFRELLKNNIELHYLGHLQTNKIRKIVRLFDVIQSVDSLEKAEKVDEVSAELKKITPIFLELNLTGEEQKHGIGLLEGEVRQPRHSSVEDTDPRLQNKKIIDSRLQEMIMKIQSLQNLKLLGFMCLGKKDNPEETRNIFRTCKQLANYFALPEVSMGMSDDYQIALEEGSTMVRLGRVIFE